MKLKTFLSTYILFLCILFSSLGIVSVYMTNSQMNMLKDRSAREYQTISASLARDISVLYGRRAMDISDLSFTESVDSIVTSYANYYRSYKIDIAVVDLLLQDDDEKPDAEADISYVKQERKHYIYITAILPEPFMFYRLDYYSDITESIWDMQSIQSILLLMCIVFSIITAPALYYILIRIFKPLDIVANASRKIAGGQYNERIDIKGKNELFSMAVDFNRMVDEVEKHMRMLEEEAIGKQQFIDNFSHEIRTPLTSIYGYAEYIQKAPLDEDEIIESAQFIMDEANHMKKMANSLLELATLRNYTPLKSGISIQCLFDDIILTLKKTLHEEGVRLICSSDIDKFEGQEDLIKSLLLNLCLNAIKSCGPNSGAVCLEAKKLNNSIVLSVTDNGCGVSDTDIEKITEPFYRVDKARSREHGSAGLGLALCKQIAEAHGAPMTIESSIGIGTTVKIIFTIP